MCISASPFDGSRLKIQWAFNEFVYLLHLFICYIIFITFYWIYKPRWWVFEPIWKLEKIYMQDNVQVNFTKLLISFSLSGAGLAVTWKQRTNKALKYIIPKFLLQNAPQNFWLKCNFLKQLKLSSRKTTSNIA